MHTIKRNERYYDLGKDKYPDEFFVDGLNDEQAERLAEDISSSFPGCEFIFYCVEVEYKREHENKEKRR